MTEQRRAWLIVGLLFLFMMLNFSDKAIVGLAGVPMMKDMGLTPRQFGLVWGQQVVADARPQNRAVRGTVGAVNMLTMYVRAEEVAARSRQPNARNPLS
jgi:hypothetical protein